jgi:hypothetical protein
MRTFGGAASITALKYENAMADCKNFRKANLFITFTFDVNCREGQSEKHSSAQCFDSKYLSSSMQK